MTRPGRRLLRWSTRPRVAFAAIAALLVLGVTEAESATRTRKASSKPPADAAAAPTYGQRDDVMRYAAEVASAHRLDPAWVEAALAGARYLPAVARLIMPVCGPGTRGRTRHRARHAGSGAASY